LPSNEHAPMSNEFELWTFVHARLQAREPVMLLVVAESSGSSPGRAGYKMAIGADGELCGSVGGGVMEVSLVEHAKVKSKKAKGKSESTIRNAQSAIQEQIHQKDSPNSSGMICSGKQTVIFRLLTPNDVGTVDSIIESLANRTDTFLTITSNVLKLGPTKVGTPNATFEKLTETDFEYVEKLGFKNDLYIIGGGHCALALSELMSKMDFHISIFDDRPELNTIEKNRFAHEIDIIDSYENIGESIRVGDNTYVVVMTLGYISDAIVMRQLINRDLKYFGVLGSKAKMATLLKELKSEGFAAERLDRIHTPIGLPINSRTPEEIAVSIAAEIIGVKNQNQE